MEKENRKLGSASMSQAAKLAQHGHQCPKARVQAGRQEGGPGPIFNTAWPECIMRDSRAPSRSNLPLTPATPGVVKAEGGAGEGNLPLLLEHKPLAQFLCCL